MSLSFRHVRDFLESWGLHFDSPTGDSTTIPYPQVYNRMLRDVSTVFSYNIRVKDFIQGVLETIDGETFISIYDGTAKTSNEKWREIELVWHDWVKESKLDEKDVVICKGCQVNRKTVDESGYCITCRAVRDGLNKVK